MFSSVSTRDWGVILDFSLYVITLPHVRIIVKSHCILLPECLRNLPTLPVSLSIVLDPTATIFGYIRGLPLSPPSLSRSLTMLLPDYHRLGFQGSQLEMEMGMQAVDWAVFLVERKGGEVSLGRGRSWAAVTSRLKPWPKLAISEDGTVCPKVRRSRLGFYTPALVRMWALERGTTLCTVALQFRQFLKGCNSCGLSSGKSLSSWGDRFFISKGNLCGTVSPFCSKPLNDLLMLLEKAKSSKLHMIWLPPDLSSLTSILLSFALWAPATLACFQSLLFILLLLTTGLCTCYFLFCNCSLYFSFT